MCVCAYTYCCLPAKARDECARPSICTQLHFALSHFMGYIICEQPPHTHSPSTHTAATTLMAQTQTGRERVSAVERVSTDFILFCDVFAVDNEKSPETFCQTTMLKSGWQSASETDAERAREREGDREGTSEKRSDTVRRKYFALEVVYNPPFPRQPTSLRLASFIALFLVFCLC